MAIEAALSETNLCDDELTGALANDIEALVSRFERSTEAQSIEVRLEAVNDDACRFFHADLMRARLVTTYIGPGTGWIPNSHGDEAVRLQDAYVGPITEIPRFSVGIFPGSLSSGGGLVHRSPRLSGTGRFRLFLCLNEAVEKP